MNLIVKYFDHDKNRVVKIEIPSDLLSVEIDAHNVRHRGQNDQKLPALVVTIDANCIRVNPRDGGGPVLFEGEFSELFAKGVPETEKAGDKRLWLLVRGRDMDDHPIRFIAIAPVGYSIALARKCVAAAFSGAREDCAEDWSADHVVEKLEEGGFQCEFPSTWDDDNEGD